MDEEGGEIGTTIGQCPDALAHGRREPGSTRIWQVQISQNHAVVNNDPNAPAVRRLKLFERDFCSAVMIGRVLRYYAINGRRPAWNQRNITNN